MLAECGRPVAVAVREIFAAEAGINSKFGARRRRVAGLELDAPNQLESNPKIVRIRTIKGR